MASTSQQTLQQEAGKESRFVDYFVICGLDETAEIEPHTFSGDSYLYSPLDRSYKAKILAHFPDIVPWNPFDENAVTMLCLPQGLSFKARTDSPQPKFHSFIITREDGSRCFGAVLVFYEQVLSESILNTMQTLLLMHQANTAISIPVGNHESAKNVSKPNSTVDVLTGELCVSKCICLITQMPFPRAGHQFLRQLHKATQEPSRARLSLESYVFNILCDVPLPPCGNSMKFFGCFEPIYVVRPDRLELPLLDFSLFELFLLLGIEGLVEIFKCIVLEHQVLLYSSDYQRLMLVAEGMTALIFPFQWQLVYVPILPASMLHFLDAPIPFIMGLCRVSDNEVSNTVLPCEANLCFVDIDDNWMECPEGLPAFPYQAELKQDLEQVFSKYHELFSQEQQSQLEVEATDLSDVPTKEADSYDAIETQESSPFKVYQRNQRRESDFGPADLIFNSKFRQKLLSRNAESCEMPLLEIYDYKFNNTVRSLFLNSFVHMFASYENFVINQTQDLESWISNRESIHNFDKTAFLSDQPASHLPFLSAFIETQMFATLMDNKVVSQWESPDQGLAVFDAEIKRLKEKSNGESRLMSYTPWSRSEEIDRIIDKRLKNIKIVADKPFEVSAPTSRHSSVSGVFPILNKELLNMDALNARRRLNRATTKWRMFTQWSQKELALKSLDAEQLEQYMRLRKPQVPDMSHAGMTQVAQTNWKFVETLLKECKVKTKKLLVEKLGQEAVDLGIKEAEITGVEENTLIASLCDLLERIWSHGLQNKKGKSAVWSHLLSYQETEDFVDSAELADQLSSVSVPSSQKSGGRSHEKTHRRLGSQGRVELPVLKPMAKSLLKDMKKIQQMSDIHTDVGKTRALIRLALERKLLSTYLKQLLADVELLRCLYKRYAFLRCEEEKEQFLYHLLSLNAVDFFCFTNTFPSSVISYRVLIYPSAKLSHPLTSANVWVSLTGQLRETEPVDVPRGRLDFSFEHKNVGVITTLRIGHDSSGPNSKWLVEYILVRNELSGHTYRFNCGRWLGRGVDDGSTERLLVAELLHYTVDTEDEVIITRPPKICSPKSLRLASNTASSLAEIQEKLGQAVNNLVQYFYKPDKERGNITFLLCGDQGLVCCIEQVFRFGFKSSRLFRNKNFIWDYIERLRVFFERELMENMTRRPSRKSPVIQQLLQQFCQLVNQINTASESVGKDGKFQVFICAALRKHSLHIWLPVMASTSVTSHMYEENSFLRTPNNMNFVVHILDSLTEFEIPVESSLMRGIDVTF